MNHRTDPHDAAGARSKAERARREALDDFWNGADRAWACLQQRATERLARSARRLQSRLDRRVRPVRA